MEKLKHALLASIGGFGNHLRWLLLLDNKYTIHIPPGSTMGMLISCPTLTKIETKVLFIKRHVYPKSRTARNWLRDEWKYRDALDNSILFLHFQKGVDYKTLVDYKKLFLVIPPNLALEHYKLLKPDLNGSTSRQFIENCQHCNKIAGKAASDKNSLMIDSGELYDSVLNKRLYQQVISFFNLEDHYDQANTIHRMWYDLKERIHNEA